jgi:hypothetical protein
MDAVRQHELGAMKRVGGTAEMATSAMVGK